MKSLLKIVAFVAIGSAMLLSASCSDDDPNNDWKKIPTEEIALGAGGEATVSFNNAPVKAGNVKLNIANENSGELLLTNIIPGYGENIIPIVLKEAKDNSWTFFGMAEVGCPSALQATKAENDILYVTAKGTVSALGDALDIKITSELTEAAQGGLVGNWQLKDTFDAKGGITEKGPLVYKWKTTATGGTGLSLVNSMLPGMATSGLSEVLQSISLDKDGNLTAKYNDKGLPETKKGFMTLKGSDPITWLIYAPNIDLKAGKITPITKEWLTSPKNVCLWYAQDGNFCVVPQIANVIAAVPNANPAIATIIGPALLGGGIKDLIASLLVPMLQSKGISIEGLDALIQALPIDQLVSQWVAAGIPLKYASQKVDGKTELKVYIDKTMAEPYMPLVINMLKGLKLSDEVVGSNFMMKLMIGMLPTIASDIEKAWAETSEFEIGLTFVKK